MLVSEPWLQKEHIQEVVFLDASEEQAYTEDQLVEEKEVAPSSLADNRAELSHPPRYDEYDDGFLEKPILYNSLGIDPIYDDYASHSESNEEIDDVFSTFEWGVSYQNVAFLGNTHLILDMISKQHK